MALLVGMPLLAGSLAWTYWREPETTEAMRGAEVARKLGCFGCHGPGGFGGIADPVSPSGKVPGWDGGTAALYVENEQQIREWVLYGAPRQRSRPEDRHGLIQMPAYEGLLSERELDDVVAYFRSVSGWDTGIPEKAYEGNKIASRLGCFGCHGPSGMGGVANPGSLKGRIPPWDGDEFAELVRDDDELREWILDGRPRRLWENPAARHFLEAQKTQMPAYRDHLSEGDLEKIVAYIRWLRSR